MDNEQISAIINETFPGLTLYYRDTTLPDDLIAKYHAGQIIKARGFTDMSYKGGGLATNLRYLIASAFGKDLSAFDPTAAAFGLIVLTSDAYFKVLDVYKIGDKTQVLLLNIPEHAVDFFKSVSINIEEDIKNKTRQRFEQLVDAEPVAILQTPGWTLRTRLPIGMSETGEMFY